MPTGALRVLRHTLPIRFKQPLTLRGKALGESFDLLIGLLIRPSQSRGDLLDRGHILGFVLKLGQDLQQLLLLLIKPLR